MNKECFVRQTDLLDLDKCKKQVCIIGAGATGSFTTLSLAKMGLSNITVYDADTIEDHNLPNQLFPMGYEGVKKVKALDEIIKSFTGVQIEANPKFYKKQPLKGIVISALDTMKGRKQIFKNCCKNNEVELLIDPRTSPNVFKLFTVNMKSETERKEYSKTLHSDAEADEGPCTAKAIIYSVLLISAYICNQVKKYLMNEDYSRDIIFDAKNNILIAQ